MDDLVAVVLFVGIMAYSVFGGADFGAGFWDLAAGGAARGARPRALIDDAMGPVWEANHVWLVFCLVVLWTAFPEAFASIMSTLFIPLTLAAIGIVLRGSAFAFRKVVRRLESRRLFGATFALSSVITPFCLGAVAGAIASGRVPPGNDAGDAWTSWLDPTSILGGVLAVATCSYLAATFLMDDARRRGGADLEEYFRRRAFATAFACGAIALVGILVLRSDARFLFDSLIREGLVFVVLSAACGLATVLLLARRAHRWVRMFAVGAVASIVAGWGVAQYPYLLPETLKIEQAAAPDATLVTLVVLAAVAALLVAPALVLLYTLDQRSLLESEPELPSV